MSCVNCRLIVIMLSVGSNQIIVQYLSSKSLGLELFSSQKLILVDSQSNILSLISLKMGQGCHDS